MFYASVCLIVLWRCTGLNRFVVQRTRGVRGKTADYGRLSSMLSVVYMVFIYGVFVYMFFVFAYDAQQKAKNVYAKTERNASKIEECLLQINAGLLFIGASAVYWYVIVYHHEQVCANEKLAAVERQLFGTEGLCAQPYNRVVDACCWTLYVLLAILMGMYNGTRNHVFVYIWGHYVLITGNAQFAVTVLALRYCYCELNNRMRAEGVRRDVLDFGGLYGGGSVNSWFVADDYPKTSTVSLVAANDSRPLQNVIFVDGKDRYTNGHNISFRH